MEVQSLLDRGDDVRVVHFQREVAKSVASDEAIGYEKMVVRHKAPLGGMRIAPILPGLYRKLARLLRAEQPDCVHCTHLFLLPFAIGLAKRKKAKVIYDAYEMFAMNWASYLPLLRRGGRYLMEWGENVLVSHVDAVLTVDSVDGLLARRYRRFNPNVTVLYNVPPRDVRMDEARVAALRAKYQGSSVIAYVGQVYEAKGLLAMLNALALVKEEISDVKLFLIGKIVDYGGEGEKLVERLGLTPYIEVMPWLPYREMLHYLAVAKVGLAVQQPTGHFLLVSRGNGRKFFTYMQAGLPIVAPAFSEVAQVVREEGCGLLVDTTNPEAISAAIVQLLRSPDVAEEMGRNGRRAFQRRYNWDEEKRKLLACYDGVMDR
ncbi:MAG: glycosyltransferase family 4 protein [Actinomycetota bacterium]|nr:glycosyltransferase family 4 protein [Actinomycetota bacterium]